MYRKPQSVGICRLIASTNPSPSPGIGSGHTIQTTSPSVTGWNLASEESAPRPGKKMVVHTFLRQSFCEPVIPIEFVWLQSISQPCDQSVHPGFLHKKTMIDQIHFATTNATEPTKIGTAKSTKQPVLDGAEGVRLFPLF